MAGQPEVCARCLTRIANLAELNDSLCGNEGDTLVEPFLSWLLHSIEHAFGEQTVFITRIEANYSLPRNRARCLGLVLCEAVMNSMKHAFRGATSGTLLVTFASVDQGYRLIVADNGVGFEKPVMRKGRGMGYMGELADELQGDLYVESLTRGTRVSLTFPA
ncbi:MAG: ATP-binding protein [Methylocystis sp.]|uniref:ATP-binding protein n=1 Tax=Methylocystis sp. TaxID=1911079 RepID=UPI003DA467F8